MNTLTTENKQELSRWVASDVKLSRLPKTLSGVLSMVKPIFDEWMQAGETFEHNTKTVAYAVRKAWEIYSQDDTSTRVGFARLFDTTIPEDAKFRDVTSNATYNRLFYLVDKVGNPQRQLEENTETKYVSVTEKRARIHKEWLKFRRQFGKNPEYLQAAEKLLQHALATIWSEEVVKELIAA